MNDFYKHPSVSNASLNAFFKRNALSGEIHTLKLLHRGECILRIGIPPYSCDDKRESYSLSKSFTSTAIGMLVTEGKLSLDCRVVDIFPDKCPAEISENLGKMRLHHVLSMNTGHEACVMQKLAYADDAASAFLAAEVQYEPGTHFTYNTGASCFLACIVERLTGMSLLDYLTAKLFIPMGIKNVTWHAVRSGQNQGGCGICVSVDDIAKLGQLYLDGGVFGGKRYLSEEWVKTATSKISDTSNNGRPDWCKGYGFQFWQNAQEGYRGDGAFGQLCMVFPEREMVAAVQGMIGDMWGEIESVYDLVKNLYAECDEPLCLPEYAPLSSDTKVSGLEGRMYLADDNPMGFTGIYLMYDSEKNAMCLNFSDGENTEQVTAGNGYWADNVIFTRGMIPCQAEIQSDLRPRRTELSASYEAAEGRITMSVRFRNCPHPTTWTITGDADRLCIDAEKQEFMQKGAEHITAKAFRE